MSISTTQCQTEQSYALLGVAKESYKNRFMRRGGEVERGRRIVAPKILASGSTECNSYWCWTFWHKTPCAFNGLSNLASLLACSYRCLAVLASVAQPSPQQSRPPSQIPCSTRFGLSISPSQRVPCFCPFSCHRIFLLSRMTPTVVLMSQCKTTDIVVASIVTHSRQNVGLPGTLPHTRGFLNQ